MKIVKLKYECTCGKHFTLTFENQEFVFISDCICAKCHKIMYCCQE